MCSRAYGNAEQESENCSSRGVVEDLDPVQFERDDQYAA